MVLGFRVKGLVSVTVIEATVYKQRAGAGLLSFLSDTGVPLSVCVYVCVCMCVSIFQQTRTPSTLLNP